MAFSWTSRRPDMHNSPLAWEKTWEADFEKNLRILARCPETLASLFPPDLAAGLASDDALMGLEQDVRHLCKQEEDLAREASRRSSEDDFEAKWLALSAAKRQEVILDGLVRTMSLPDMEERRQWCPESTLKNLNAGEGEGYLRLLRALMPKDRTGHIMEPVFVPHPVVDRIFTPSPADLATPGMKSAFKTFRVSRSYCLATLVWNIFLAFHGESETQVPVKPPKGHGLDPSLKKYARASKEFSATRKAHDYACWNCGRNEKALPSGTKLQACGKCLHLGRKVFYCSRECQVKDWKAGQPRPHKAICGKPLVEDELEQEPVGSNDDSTMHGIPPPDPSYSRSPALLHQISLITENRDQGLDYVIVAPYPDPDHGIAFSSKEAKFAFVIQRTRAFRSGDALAVKAIYAMLCTHVAASGISRGAIRKQLQTEFGHKIDDRPVDLTSLPPPTDEEVKFVVPHVKQQFIRATLAHMSGAFSS